MIETLTAPLGGPSHSFLFKRPLLPLTSTTKVTFRVHTPCKTKALLQADPVVDPAYKRRATSSLYDVLRVKHDATSHEIKTAYRKLAKVYHPDSHPDCSDIEQHDEGKFIEIHNAYATLYDPADRATYDLKLNMGLDRRSGSYTNVGKRRGVYMTRRWETDQCW